MKNREFTIKNVNFCIKDNFPYGKKPPRAEFEGKYYIMYEYDVNIWHSLGMTVNTKREAIEILKRKAKNYEYPFY